MCSFLSVVQHEKIGFFKTCILSRSEPCGRMWVCLRPDLAERMVKDSAGQERPIKLGPKLWVTVPILKLFCPMDESSLPDSLCPPGEEYRGRPVHCTRDVWVISDDPHVPVAALRVTGGRACALQSVYATQQEPADARLNVM